MYGPAVQVAIKHVEMTEKKARFIKREIAISRVLHHPNIVHLFDVYFEDFSKEVEMVFELVDGAALLDTIVSHGHLKEKVARPLFRQILEAVGSLMRMPLESTLAVKLTPAALRELFLFVWWRQTTATSIALCTATSKSKIFSWTSRARSS